MTNNIWTVQNKQEARYAAVLFLLDLLARFRIESAWASTMANQHGSEHLTNFLNRIPSKVCACEDQDISD